MPASAMIGSKHAQPAYQNRHLRPAQLEQLGAVDEQLLGRHAEANRKIVAETVGLRLQWLEAVRIGLFGGRAEERRVGKECVSTGSSGWSPEHEKKKISKKKP